MAETAQIPTAEEIQKKKESAAVDVEAYNLLAQGKRNMLCQEIPQAVNQLQEACSLLAKKYGETAIECGEAYLCYGKSLLELSRMESGVLGNALQGVNEDTEDEEAASDDKVESADDLPEKEREEIMEQVVEAMGERDEEVKAREAKKKTEGDKKDAKPAEETKGDSEDKPSDAKDKMETEANEKTEAGDAKEKVEAESDKKPEAGDAPEKMEADDAKEKPEEDKAKELSEEEEAKEKPEEDKAKEKPEEDNAKEKPEEEKAKEKPEAGDAKEKAEAADAKKDVEPSTAKDDEKTEEKKEMNGTAAVAVNGKHEGEAKENGTNEEEMETDLSEEKKDKDADKSQEDTEEEGGTEEEGADTGEEGEESEAKDEEGEGKDGEEGKEEEEDVGNLQLAWEMLELAKIIYSKQETKEMQLKAAESLLTLGEVGLETEQYQQAVEDFQECLKLQEIHLEADNRKLAETHYQLGLARSFNGLYDEAVDAYKKAISVIESKIGNLEKFLEDNAKAGKGKDPIDFEDPITKAEKEIEELKSLLPDIQGKIEDAEEEKKNTAEMKQLVKEGMASEFSTTTGFGESSSSISSSATSSKASDITHLVRRKRKPEDEDEKKPEEETTKKARQEDVNGVDKSKEESKDKQEKEMETTEQEKSETEKSETEKAEPKKSEKSEAKKPTEKPETEKPTEKPETEKPTEKPETEKPTEKPAAEESKNAATEEEAMDTK